MSPVDYADDVLPEVRSRAEILAINRIQGRAFEELRFPVLKEILLSAEEQITVKTASGVRTRIDAMGLDASGNVRLYEFKSSATARLTPNQKKPFRKYTTAVEQLWAKAKAIFLLAGIVFRPEQWSRLFDRVNKSKEI